MAVTVTPKSLSVSLKLNNGTTDSGTVKTTSVSLGTMSIANYNADKAMAIVGLLTPCLSKALVRVEKTSIDVLTATA